MAVTFETGRGVDEQVAYVDGEEVCRIPGPVVIEIQRRLGVENPKGSVPSGKSPTLADGKWYCSHASFDQWCLACAHKVIAHLRHEVEHALLVTNALIASPVLPAHNRIMVRELNGRLRQEVESWRLS